MKMLLCNRFAFVAVVLLAVLVSGCASVRPNRVVQSLDAKDAALPALVKPWVGVGAGVAPVDYVGISVSNDEEFILKEMEGSDPLPKFMVKGFSYNNAALYDVIRTLLDQSDQDVSLSFDLNSLKMRSAGARISGYNVKGSFATILENLSKTSGFYYRYKGGVLMVSSDRQYITPLPPVNELLESIPSVIANLGATDVVVDRSARLLTFRASRNSQEKIASYLAYIRNNRSLITYDCYIWEVVLNDQSQLGINWRDFPVGAAGAAGAVASGIAATYGGGGGLSAAANLMSGNTPGSTGIGLVLSGAHFKLNTLIEFLQAQGTVNTISQPKISLLSGTMAQFRNGVSIPYVSRISPGAITNGVWIPGSAETSTLQTGINLQVAGDISDGTVFSDVSLKMSDLVSIDKQQVASQGGTTTISLPVSADREVSTRVRARPGDAMIVGGINLQRVSNSFNGFGPVPTSSDKAAQRSEMVVVLIPRITYFVAQGKAAHEEQQ